MRNEIIRMPADWLADATYGVNALLPDVPRDGGDAQPADVVAILDETRHGPAARGKVSKEQATPVLLVTLHRAYKLGPIQQGYRDARDVTIAISCVIQDAQSEKGLQDVGYIMRAVERSMGAFFDNANQGARLRNNIQIVHEAYEFEQSPAYAEIGDAVIAGALLVTMSRVRDLAP